MAYSKPNILFIFTDQMRGDTLGTVEGSQVITPNLDRIADEGIRFSRCISNAPLCVPARTCLMTGQLVRENGIWSNRSGADPTGPSHVRNIRDVGYHTAVIGKTHLWRESAAGKRGQHVLEMEHNLDAWGFESRHEINDPIETAWMGCHYTDYLDEHGWLDAHRRYIMAWVDEMRTGNITPWGQIPAPVPPGEDIDSYIGRKAVEWIRSYQEDKPFYLQVQFTGPHDPFDGPLPYRAMYDVESLDPGLAESHPAPSSDIQARRDHAISVAKATTNQRQRWRAWYYANITLIDECIGRILEALREQALLDDTWIVFNSDHGEMLGDHGLSSKAVFYNEAMCVPCIIRPAQRTAGLVSSALVEHIDLPATMLEIAGADALEGTLGKSLLPYLELDRSDSRLNQGKRAVVSELFGQTALVTDDCLLTVGIKDKNPVLMFDHAVDPQQLTNVVKDPERIATQQELVEEFIDPLDSRINQHLLEDYVDYVKRTGRVN